ncbi:response regulator transcription factor [Herbaspirillum sp. LeCh32-8]|uniref:response regulator n=1 Tax=Herbaspirillum sp. LeCh32-8 TaxID=2821356 RepID=UPI001AE708EB|nr:response regulator transcription factor [Herbaspirillum sp. LeCh32-8]MBP0598133.1 response regulator transcription factor [Herbaspirillum sp. LeCh32-8]
MNPTILLVDDHAVVREGLASLLSIGRRFERIAQAADGAAAIAVAGELQPDLIVVDLLMPGMTGPEAIRLLKQASPRSRIAVLTSTEDDQLALAALKAGASSYLIKSMSGDDILSALSRMALGEDIIHPSVSNGILRMSLRQGDQPLSPFGTLTPREVDVLTELAKGASNARIAQALNITERTVKSHIGNVLSKLNLSDRTEAVAFAWRNGLMQQ